MTVILQSKARGTRSSRRVCLDMAPGTDWSLLVVFSRIQCYACVPSAGSQPTDSQTCP